MRKPGRGQYVPMSVSVTMSRHEHLRRLASQCDTSVSAIINASLDDFFSVNDDAVLRKRLSEMPLRS
jgi:hypothetical protein